MENTTYLIKNVKVKATQSSFPDINTNTTNKLVEAMTWEEMHNALEYMFTEFKNTFGGFGFKSMIMTFDYYNTQTPETIHSVDFGFDEEGDVYCS